MVEQRLADGFGGSTYIDEQRGVVGDQPGCGATDRLLLLCGDLAPRLIFHVLDAGRKQRAAMDACQQALVAKVIEVLADGLRRHAEMCRQVFDQNPAVVLGHLDDLGMAWRKIHPASSVFVFLVYIGKRKQ